MSWDAIVIGSGIGGLACAAALARSGRRVISTPLTTAHYTPAPRGVRTPVRGLYLAGQDAMSPGITGALMGGVLAAAAVEPRIHRRLAA